MTIKKLCKWVDSCILSHFTDYSLIIDWYLPKYGTKQLVKVDEIYGFMTEGWFYPLDAKPYFCKYCPNDFEIIN